MRMLTLVARVTLAELLRRRSAVALITVLPFLFFLVRLETPWTALRLLAMGLGWGVATLALFTHVSSHALDRRLVVAGARPVEIHLGRQLAVLAFGTVLALVYFGVVAIAIPDGVERLWTVLVLLLLTVLVAVPLGSLVAAAVPRDLEGAMLLLAVMAVQILVDPADEWTRALPMWSTRELATHAIEPVCQDYLVRGLVHGAITTTLLSAAGLALASWRLRTRAVPPPRDQNKRDSASSIPRSAS